MDGRRERLRPPRRRPKRQVPLPRCESRRCATNRETVSGPARTRAFDACCGSGPEQAQQLLNTWCTQRGDVRLRATADGKATVATLATREPLRPAPPVPFPATVSVARTVSAQALGVLPRQLLQRRAEFALACGGAMIRDHGHVLALEQVAMAAASPAAPHRRKQRTAAGQTAEPAEAVIDLARYAAAAHGRNTLTT